MSTPAEKARASPSKTITRCHCGFRFLRAPAEVRCVMGRSITFRGGLLSLTRAIGASAHHLPLRGGRTLSAGVHVIVQWADESVRPYDLLDVNRRPARLANRGQRIARALFLLDPLLFVADDVEQQLFILRAREDFLHSAVRSCGRPTARRFRSGTSSLPIVRCCG